MRSRRNVRSSRRSRSWASRYQTSSSKRSPSGATRRSRCADSPTRAYEKRSSYPLSRAREQVLSAGPPPRRDPPSARATVPTSSAPSGSDGPRASLKGSSAGTPIRSRAASRAVVSARLRRSRAPRTPAPVMSVTSPRPSSTSGRPTPPEVVAVATRSMSFSARCLLVPSLWATASAVRASPASLRLDASATSSRASSIDPFRPALRGISEHLPQHRAPRLHERVR